jgi:2-amino-4-hydroxy-6-hydroxymethyldihydropteridine diphosphokinase
VTTLVATSSIYETAPVGGPDQGAYLNAVAVVETDLAPRRLLDVMLDVERRMGRVRRERWGPRTIDLDLLLHGDSAVDEPGLTVPHPRLTERRFALEPLLEAWPEATLPDGRPLADFLEAVADQDVVRVASSE